MYHSTCNLLRDLSLFRLIILWLFFNGSSAYFACSQPVASFTATPVKGCNPLKVDFTNTSTGAVSYLWKFGNGNFSTNTSPSAIYNNAGKYSVTLIATDAGGLTDTAYFADLITAFKPPIADFTASPKEICAGDTVAFQDLSTPGDGTISTWSWDMGDGGTVTGKNPKYVYSLDGTFNVTFAITDVNGCSHFAKYVKFIKVNPLPTLAINNSAIQKCSVPVSINFSSTASGAATLVYNWDFGDGKTASGASPSHTFDSSGKFTITLKVTDGKGCVNKVSKGNLITILPPVADFDASQKSLCPHDQVQFLNRSTPSDGTGTYSWSFSNGQSSAASDPVVYFHNPGNYNATLKYTWDGCTSTKTITNFITVRDTPTGTITPRDTTLCRRNTSGLNYTVNGSNIEYIIWNSGRTGPVNVNIKSPFIHPLDVNGKYTIRATAYSIYGCKTRLDSTFLTVRGPTADVKVDTFKGCILYKVHAKWVGKSDAPVQSFAWSGGGLSGSDSFIDFTNTVFGRRYILLKVTDINGCSDAYNAVLDAGLKVDLALTAPEKICRNQKFYLHRKSNINHPDSVKFFYYWDNLDSLVFPPPDSLVRRLTDTPGTVLKYGLIANSYGCVTKLADSLRPLVRVMGPQIQAMVKSDCGKDTVFGINQSKEYTKSWWRYKTSVGSTQYAYTKNLSRVIEETKDLWLFAENDTNKCYDSLPFNTTIDDQRAFFNYVYNCDSQKIQTINTYIGLQDSQFYWELTYVPTGAKTYFQGRNLNIKLPNTGEYSLLLSPYNPKFTCTRPYRKRIVAFKKPSAKASATLVDNTCYPVTFLLRDPTWNTWFKGEWQIGRFLTVKDSQASLSVGYIDNQSNINTILIRYDSNLCVYKDTFPFIIGGVKCVIDNKQITDPCSISKIFTEAKLSNGTNGATYTYNWDWGFKKTYQSKDTVIEGGIKSVSVTLLVQDNKGCASKDVRTFQIKTGRPTARFKVSDTIGTCPPLNVQFTDSSKPGNSPLIKWFWDFGDSSYSGKTNPGKIFIYPGQFSVKLVVTNAEGCKDTAILPNFIKINGPLGNYKADINDGCTPLKVKLLTTTAGKISKMEFDMGDGSVLNAKDSFYTYTRSGTYIPRLILIDSFGCKYSPPPDDTIAVHPLPIADFSNFKACGNQVYPVSNQSYYSGDPKGKVRWQLNGNAAQFGDTVKLHFAPGRNHTLNLYTTTIFGCADSLQKPFVAYNISPAIAPGKPKYCLGEKIKIVDKSTADTQIVKTNIWIDGFALDPVKMTVPGASRGILPAFMIVTDALGCSDTFTDSLFIKVGDTLPPPPLFIYRSTVNDNFTTETRFNSSVEPDFDHYNLYSFIGGSWKKMNSSSNRADTNLIATPLNTLNQSWCHSVAQVNYCYRASDSAVVIPHCTIETKALGDTNKALVSWTPYNGWKSVARYRIWRKKKTEDTFSLIDSVAGNQLNYVDTSVYCHIEYDYKIEGIEQNGFRQISFSDTARAKPIHFQKVAPPEVWRVTVDTNFYTHTEWVAKKPPKYPIMKFRVWKNDQSGWALLADSLPFSRRYFNDSNTRVSEQYYSYAIDATDVCNTTSAKGQLGRSILLKIAPVTTEINPRLNWTPYIIWNEGVKEYVVERSINKSAFLEIGRVNGIDTTYLDETLPRYCAKDFTYRVKAIRNQPLSYPDSSFNCISVSNYASFAPEIRFFIPNAFTPNHNNLNENFHPDGMFFYKYTMQIFNRYGQMVYEGNACMNEWDGNFNSKPSPDGVYAYLIKVWDLKGQVYKFNGTIHLMR